MNDFNAKTLLEVVNNCFGMMAEEVELSTKYMFGGIMCYAYGRPFISLSNVGIGVKLSSAERDDLLTIDGTKPLRYEPNSPPSKSYTIVPFEWHQEFEKLLPVLQQSATYVKTLPLPKKRNKKN